MAVGFLVFDVVLLAVSPVGEDEVSFFIGSEDAARSIVDGIGQQVDVIAVLLDFGDVLHVSFEDDVAVLELFTREAFGADVVYLVVVLDAIG